MHIDFIQWFDEKIGLVLSKISHKDRSEKFVQQIEYLNSIPSVGFLFAVTLMCEIGNFSSLKGCSRCYYT